MKLDPIPRSAFKASLIALALGWAALGLVPLCSAQTSGPIPAEPAVVQEPADTPLAQAVPAQAVPAQAVPTPAGPTSNSTEPMREGAQTLVDQGAGMWNQVLLPMWQRLATALPVLAKAILILILFWLAALLLQAAVKKLLDMTTVDERTIEAWGLSSLLRREDGSSRSFSDLAGAVVKWTVLLFGFVAFFQALDLEMVAKPLQGVAESIVGVIPGILQAAVILLVYWIISSAVRALLRRAMVAANFDQRAERYFGAPDESEKRTPPSSALSNLAFYLILLFGLPPFLEALGQAALIRPLASMLEKGLSFLPNIFAALMIFLIGKLVAVIVREVVGNFLSASGVDAKAEQLGINLGSTPVSRAVASIAYFFVLISIIVAAVESLGITAISDPVKQTLEKLLGAVPQILVAMIVLAAGWVVARAVREITRAFLEGIGFNQYPERFGLSFLNKGTTAPDLATLGGHAVMAVILLLTAEQAFATLGLDQLAAMIAALLAYLPNLLAGTAIILISLSLSSLASSWILESLGDSPTSRIGATILKYAIIFLGLSMGLSQLGVGEQIMTVAVAATFSAVALALGLAFGFGGRQKAKEIIQELSANTSEVTKAK